MTKGRPPASRTPQEKKAKSYAHDCRNTYGENDKASRKAIPQRKAGENRKARRKAGHVLNALEAMDESKAEVVESSLRHDVERVGGWRKGADTPLGAYVADRKEWAARRVGSNARVRAEMERQKSAPDFDGSMGIGSDVRFPE